MGMNTGVLANNPDCLSFIQRPLYASVLKAMIYKNKICHKLRPIRVRAYL